MPLCRYCFHPISFDQLPSGKLRPINADGSVHFATCSMTKGPRPPDDTCTKCGSLDVERLPGKGQHWGAIRCRDCGVHRWLRKPEEIAS